MYGAGDRTRGGRRAASPRVAAGPPTGSGLADEYCTPRRAAVGSGTGATPGTGGRPLPNGRETERARGVPGRSRGRLRAGRAAREVGLRTLEGPDQLHCDDCPLGRGCSRRREANATRRESTDADRTRPRRPRGRRRSSALRRRTRSDLDFDCRASTARAQGECAAARLGLLGFSAAP